MPLVNGATAAGFRIIQQLGAGGMGEVYVADHPRLPRRDALKILPADVSADPQFRERFNREADLAASLWHPHIVGVHDRGEFEGQLWISMDYVDGSDAAQLLRESYPTGMPPDDVVEIVTAIADALDYAHNHGLLHRDVKPGNILITRPASEERRILLGDFGIARRIDDASGLTQTNMAVGTVSYAAPEQLMGRALDGRADQYALAATTFHLLTGSPPFTDSNPAVVISKHLNGTPPLLRDVRPELANLDEPFSHALAKDPADRFPRCQDFAAALEASWKGLRRPPGAGPTAPAAQPAPTPVRPDDVAIANAATQRAARPNEVEPAASAAPPAAAPKSVRPAAPAAPPPTAARRATYREPPAPVRRHRLRRTIYLLIILALALLGFFIFMTARSGPHQPAPPPGTNTPSSESTVPSASQQPATTTPQQTTTASPSATTTSPLSTTASPSATTPQRHHE